MAKQVAKNMVAAKAVPRLKKLAEPAAPNTPCALPEPNAAPASAPLPCCNNTNTITARAEKILTNKIMVFKASIASIRSVSCCRNNLGKTVKLK